MKTNRTLKQHGDGVADSCHAILKTTNDEVSTLAKPHNLPSDKTAVEIEKCRQIMKQQANSTNDRPSYRWHHLP